MITERSSTMLKPRRVASAALILLGVLLVARPGEAQTPCFDGSSSRQAVYYAGPNNDISCVLDFATGQSRSVVLGAQGTNFNGIYVLYEGVGSGGGLSIVAGSTTQGGEIQVYDCDANGENCASRGVAAAFSQVKGVALDTFGNIAAVSGSRFLYVPRCTKGDPGCPASGYGAKVGPSTVPDLSQLVDVRFVSSAIATSTAAGTRYQPGDVLVLGPTQLRAYKLSSSGTLTASTLVANLPGGSVGTGLALFPKSGEALVTTNGGRVLVFGRTGSLLPDFVSGIGQGVNAAIGNNAATGNDPAHGAEVFITANSNGRVIRYVAKRSGSGLVADPAIPAQVVGTGNPPYGVGNATLTDAAWTAAGTNVAVQPAVGHDLTFEKVNVSGFSQSRVYLIEQSQVSGGILDGTLVGLPDAFEVAIPSHVGCFARAVGPAGCYYLVYVADTSADVFGATQEHHFDEAPFGLDASCDSEPTPRLYRAPDDTDPAIVEGGVFADITTGCGSHIGRGGEFSLFLTGWDSRTPGEIAGHKLANLKLALSGTNVATGGLSPFIKKNTRSSLGRDVDKAIAAFNRGNETQAQSYLASVVSTVKASLGSFTRCVSGVCRNTPGEIIARAESASFEVCLAGETGTLAACSRELGH